MNRFLTHVSLSSIWSLAFARFCEILFFLSLISKKRLLFLGFIIYGGEKVVGMVLNVELVVDF